MGFTQDVFNRVSKFFARDKDQSNINLARGNTNDRYDANAMDLLKASGFEALSQYLRIDNDILTRYSEYESMDEFSEIACFTADSEIGIIADAPTGVQYVTVSTLLKMRLEDPDKQFYTLAVDLAAQKVVPALFKGPVLSGKQQPVFKVTFEEYRSNPGQPKKVWSVRATSNHPFMLRDGTYKTVAQLRRGDRLMAAGLSATAQGYVAVRDLFRTAPQGKSLKENLHRLIGEHILRPGTPIAPEEVVHHLDGRRSNNHPSNLQIMLRSEHTKSHAPTKDPAIRERLRAAAKARWDDPVEAKKWSATHRKLPLEDLAILRNPNPTPKGILTDAHREAIARGHTLPLAKDIVENALRAAHSIADAARTLNVSESTLNRRVAQYGLSRDIVGSSIQSIHLGDAAYSNHVVVSIEPDGFDDVYDIEVPQYRNFLAVGGVFVHNTALDILADDATQPDTSLNRTIWITAKDRTLQDNLDDLINRTLRLDEEIWEIARTLCKYGSEMEEILVNEHGVRGLNYIPPATGRRIEGPRGDLIGFIQDYSGRFDYGTADFNQFMSSKANGSLQGFDGNPANSPVAVFEPWEVVHFRLRGKERRSLYGFSVMEPARWIWKRLVLLEDAALVYRLQRAPERFAFYVDTGDLPPNESMAFVNRVRQNFRKKKFVDPASGKLNLKFETLAPLEDFFVPSRKGVDSTRIENLGSPQWQCLVGDTRIPLLDGTNPAIQELADRGGEFWVYSIDSAGRVVPGKGHSARKTHDAAEIWEVTLDNGQTIRCTGNHPFMTRDGKWLLAEHLREGDALMPLLRDAKGGAYDPYKDSFLSIAPAAAVSLETDAAAIHAEWVREAPSDEKWAALDIAGLRYLIRATGARTWDELYTAGRLSEAVVARILRENKLSWPEFGYQTLPYWLPHPAYTATCRKVVAVQKTGEIAPVYDLTVETHANFAVEAGVFVSNSMEDVEYFRDKLFAAIKVPKAYLGQEAGVARAVLSSEDVRFARTVLRIQRELKNGIRKIIRVHLSALNIDPYAVEYEINMTVPSSIFELAQIEVRNAKADLAARMRDFVSLHWILANVFGMSEAEIEDLKKQRKIETVEDAKTQNDAAMAAQPPMEGEEGATGGEEEGGEAEPLELAPEDGEAEGEYGPPPEEAHYSQLLQPKNILTERIDKMRMRAHRRNIPTHNYISDRELFEHKRDKATERRQEQQLAQLLENDRALADRFRELGNLLKDIKFASVRRR